MAKKSGRKGRPKRAAGKAVAKKAVAAHAAATPKSGPEALEPNRLKPAKNRLSFKNRVKHPVQLPSARQVGRQAALTLWEHRKLFIGITAVYGLLNILLAQSLSGATDVSSVRQTLGHLKNLDSGIKAFGSLINSAGSGSDPAANAYKLFLGLVFSLAVIWALRQVLTGATIRIRDAYYRGMYPLIPFILVLLVIGLQLIPLLIGSTLYALVINNNLAVHLIEQVIWTLVFGVLALVSLYMISSSLFAVYIVTLPDMAPLKALRSARDLVRHRRWTVMRKILCLPLFLLIIATVVMVPIIVWLTPLSKWAFFVLSICVLPVSHAYMYTLYRELLNE
ncbi:MAG TPA: hypothetical protein VII55_03170 [Candidatus Saccharimonadales bacterium]